LPQFLFCFFDDSRKALYYLLCKSYTKNNAKKAQERGRKKTKNTQKYVLPLSFIDTKTNLPDNPETPRQKYTRGFIVGRTHAIHSDLLRNFTGVKNCEI